MEKGKPVFQTRSKHDEENAPNSGGVPFLELLLNFTAFRRKFFKLGILLSDLLKFTINSPDMHLIRSSIISRYRTRFVVGSLFYFFRIV